MKPLSIVGLTILGLLAALFAVGYWTLAPIGKVGDGFFDAWSAGQPQRSYPYLSYGFTQAISAEQLHKFMADHRLDRGVKTSWSKRSFQDRKGNLAGTVTRSDGSAADIAMELVKEQDLWKIFKIEVTSPPQIAGNNGYGPPSQNNNGQAWGNPTNQNNSGQAWGNPTNQNNTGQAWTRSSANSDLEQDTQSLAPASIGASPEPAAEI